MLAFTTEAALDGYRTMLIVAQTLSSTTTRTEPTLPFCCPGSDRHETMFTSYNICADHK
jgi:hypothetical protein